MLQLFSNIVSVIKFFSRVLSVLLVSGLFNLTVQSEILIENVYSLIFLIERQR